MSIPPSNTDIAHVLERVADLLQVQEANGYRVRAYRNAAQRVRDASDSIADLALNRPRSDLEALPAIGASIASAIREYVSSGRLGLLNRLEGQVSPEDLFASVPGIGEELARRIHTVLGIETLEELEAGRARRSACPRARLRSPSNRGVAGDPGDPPQPFSATSVAAGGGSADKLGPAGRWSAFVGRRRVPLKG